MRVKQAKLGQAIKGETSNVLSHDQYEMKFEGGMLHVKKRVNPKNLGPFIVFPANLAYIEVLTDQEALSDSKTEAKRGKK